MQLDTCSQPKEASRFSHTETTTSQPYTGTPNEHVRVDVSVHVFESQNQRHHSQHHISNAPTAPPAPPFQHPLALSQPTLPSHPQPEQNKVRAAPPPAPPFRNPPALSQPVLPNHPQLEQNQVRAAPPAPPLQQPPALSQPRTINDHCNSNSNTLTMIFLNQESYLWPAWTT
ncbi:hypothetical protein EV702DRAFT_1194602 [Suillus placidus]|uniref:Uncharacterized protein n=1 Tax=Suillus placidus TaxID=48579 RepID=A0A9P7A155_9AGAM|nr:hypothetical protein EV702DRAFT_1194602 [Suillus placidus]